MQEIDTGTEDLLARVEDGVAVLTMNRPERRNALSPAMLDALARTLADAEADDDVGCVVLTGAGGAFCAGGDVKAMAQDGAGEAGFDARVQLQRRSHRATAGRLHEMPKPTIAAVGGAAAGAGLSLALACDLRYAARRAVLTTAFAKVGFAGSSRASSGRPARASCTSSPTGSEPRRPSGWESSARSSTTTGSSTRSWTALAGSPTVPGSPTAT